MNGSDNALDILYSAIEKINSIQEDIFYSVSAFNADNYGSSRKHQQGIDHVIRLSEILKEATDFADYAIQSLENSHHNVANY